MLTSIIVPVWNGLSLIEACLASVAALEGAAPEIIAVDNGSVDGSADYIAAHFPQVKLVRNELNLGFGAACNQGMALAQGDLLVLLNQDAQLAPDWLTEIHAALAATDAGIVGCKILYDDGVTLQHAGAWVEWPLGIVHHYGVGDADTGQWDTLCPVEIVTFAAVAIRRAVVEAVGLFDLGFGLGYFEDVDYCVRARQAGFEIVYAPGATVRHRESSSIGRTEMVHYQYQQGRLRLVIKHLPLSAFVHNFVPAEIESQKLGVRNQVDSTPLRWAYLGAMSAAAEFYGAANPREVAAVYQGLQTLYQTAWAETTARVREKPPVYPIPEPGLPPAFETRAPDQNALFPKGPSLDPIEFKSDMPVAGSLISWIRRTWYNMAARWGDQQLINHLDVIMQERIETGRWISDFVELSQQRIDHQAQVNRTLLAALQDQEALNRRLEEDLRSLSAQVAGLTAENSRLAGQMAENKEQVLRMVSAPADGRS